MLNIVNLNEPADLQSEMHFDVCIVGTGPSGSTIAAELFKSNLRVLVIESGDLRRSVIADRLSQVENIGYRRLENQWFVRNRILGGSAHTWGGRCAPFDYEDFSLRSWVPNSGWPISYRSLEGYLSRAAEYLGLNGGSWPHDDSFWFSKNRKIPLSCPADGSVIPFIWQYSRAPNGSYPFEYARFGKTISSKLPQNSMLVLGATVTEVISDSFAGSIRAIKFTSVSKKKYTAFVKAVVLCAGGIENPRIMLCSKSSAECGLGNQNGLVGRYFMDHLRGPVGSFKLSDSRKLQKVFGRYVIGKNLYRVGLRLSPKRQKDDGLLNAAAWLGETVSANDPWNALRHIAKTKRVNFQDSKNIGSNLGLIGAGLFDFFNSGSGMPRVYESLTLDCMTEQVPNYDSRISLSDRTDHFGIRLPKIDWRIDPLELTTVKALTTAIALEAKKLGLPDVDVAKWIHEEQDFSSEFVDVAHPMGTTRMSNSNKSGVVDVNCESYFTKGLFLAGSSVFPTGSHCNPTLMIVALAIRIADKLKDTYKQYQD